MEQVQDTSASAGSHPPGRDAQPGRRRALFLNNCIGCHSGMDPMAQAFAYYDLRRDGRSRLVYTQRRRCSRSTSSTPTTSSTASSRRTTAGRTAGAPGQNALLGWAGEPAGQRQRRQVARRGAREQRCVRAVPGRESVPQRLLPRAVDTAGVISPDRARSTRWSARSSERLQPEAGVRRVGRVLHGQLRETTMKRVTIHRSFDSGSFARTRVAIALLALLLALRLAGCGGGADHRANPVTTPPERPDVHRSGAGDRRRPGVPHQLLGQRRGHQPLRQLPQRRRPGAAVRARRRRQPRVRSRQSRSSISASPSRLAHGREGRRRSQLLAAGNAACARHPDALDHQLGRRAAAGGGTQIELDRRRRSAIRARAGTSRDTPPAAFARRAPRCSPTYCSRCHTLDCGDPAVAVLRLGRHRRGVRGGQDRRSTSTTPANSRFVVRLRSESHNCWTIPRRRELRGSADLMQAAIEAMSAGIPLTQSIRTWSSARRSRSIDGTIASGGNRYEHNVIALYEFKTGNGNDRVRHQRCRAGG